MAFTVLGTSGKFRLGTVVKGSNPGPVVTDSTGSAFADGAVAFFTPNSTDPAGGGLTVEGVSITSGSGTAQPSDGNTRIAFTPPGSAGTSVIAFTVRDTNGKTDSGIVTVTVAAAPSVGDRSLTLHVEQTEGISQMTVNAWAEAIGFDVPQWQALKRVRYKTIVSRPLHPDTLAPVPLQPNGEQDIFTHCVPGQVALGQANRREWFGPFLTIPLRPRQADFDYTGTDTLKYQITCEAVDKTMIADYLNGGGSDANDTPPVTATVTITVTNPVAHFTGANLICVDPEGAFSGFPAGANRQEFTNLDSAINAASGRSQSLVLVRNGYDYPNVRKTVKGRGRFWLMGWGSGPLSDTQFRMTLGSLSTGNKRRGDYSICDIELIGNYDASDPANPNTPTGSAAWNAIIENALTIDGNWQPPLSGYAHTNTNFDNITISGYKIGVRNLGLVVQFPDASNPNFPYRQFPGYSNNFMASNFTITNWQNFGLLPDDETHFGMVGFNIYQHPDAPNTQLGKGSLEPWHGPLRYGYMMGNLDEFGFMLLAKGRMFNNGGWSQAHQSCIRQNTNAAEGHGFHASQIITDGVLINGDTVGNASDVRGENCMLYFNDTGNYVGLPAQNIGILSKCINLAGVSQQAYGTAHHGIRYETIIDIKPPVPYERDRSDSDVGWGFTDTIPNDFTFPNFERYWQEEVSCTRLDWRDYDLHNRGVTPTVNIRDTDPDFANIVVGNNVYTAPNNPGSWPSFDYSSERVVDSLYKGERIITGGTLDTTHAIPADFTLGNFTNQPVCSIPTCQEPLNPNEDYAIDDFFGRLVHPTTGVQGAVQPGHNFVGI